MMVAMLGRNRGTGAERPRTARIARRFAMGAFCGAVAALGVSSVLTLGGRSVDGGSPFGSPRFEAPVGSCLNWTAPDGSDVHLVGCEQPHLFETVGSLNLSNMFGPAAAFPSESAWLSLVEEKCTPLVSNFFDGRYDPFGRFTVGALKPSQPGWRNGDRSLHCGLQVVTRSGELYRVEGGARGQDQADVHPPGTCLGIDGVDVGDPVECSQPHTVEVVGILDLSVPFPEPDYPDEAKQDDAAGPACTKLAEEYAGGPNVVTEKKLTVYWDTLRPESWHAGTRKVDCKLGALLPDKSGFAPVTGGVRGAVQIGDEPPPAVSTTATPGVPALDPPPLVSSPTGG
jgi:Septum formation